MKKGPAQTKPKTKAQEVLDSAAALLDQAFNDALSDHHSGAPVGKIPKAIQDATEALFKTSTASWREILIGVALLRALDPDVDIHLPRKDQGSVVTGRTITERIVTPFMAAQRVPVLKNPYLSVGRGDLRFEKGGESRKYRDPEAFETLVEIVTYLRTPDQKRAQEYLRYLLKRFIELRESANIPLIEVARLSLDQYQILIGELLPLQSGGRLPPLIGVAMLQTLSTAFGLKWDIEWQGINVADKSSGAVGDITVKSSGKIITGLEVTERPVDEARVSSTFNEKIAPNKLEDYLFVLTKEPSQDARDIARKFFGMGHEVNFVQVDAWAHHVLSIVGPAGRSIFQKKMVALLSAVDVPADLKVAWNKAITKAIAS
jgi:hypothetical protein